MAGDLASAQEHGSLLLAAVAEPAESSGSYYTDEGLRQERLLASALQNHRPILAVMTTEQFYSGFNGL